MENKNYKLTTEEILKIKTAEKLEILALSDEEKARIPAYKQTIYQNFAKDIAEYQAQIDLYTEQVLKALADDHCSIFKTDLLLATEKIGYQIGKFEAFCKKTWKMNEDEYQAEMNRKPIPRIKNTDEYLENIC